MIDENCNYYAISGRAHVNVNVNVMAGTQSFVVFL